MSTRTVSARIDTEQHEKILEICNVNGWTVNEFMNQCIGSMLQCETDGIKEKKKSNDGIDRSNFDTWMKQLDAKSN